MTGNNSIINLHILRILTSLDFFFNHEFYCRLPVTDACKNGKTVPWKKLPASYELVFEPATGLWNYQNILNHKDLVDTYSYMQKRRLIKCMVLECILTFISHIVNYSKILLP